jgi:hypothetical protein
LGRRDDIVKTIKDWGNQSIRKLFTPEMSGHSRSDSVYSRQEVVEMSWCKRETPLTNLYQNVLDAVSHGLNILQVDGTSPPLNTVGGSKNIGKQVGPLIGRWVLLQRKKAFAQYLQMFLEFCLKGGH